MKTDFDQELNELDAIIDRLRRGELTRTEFRARTVHYGVYTQRQADRYFVRLRVPQGIISPAQLKALAGAIDAWAAGECHLTTRQGIEVHDLALDQIMPLLRALGGAGLLSHETGGNSVRSVMVCPHAAVGLNEPFDVTPYAALLTRYFVRHPDCQKLPRKMKIGLAGCAEDCTHTFVQDLGLQARLDPAGQRGFRVLVGGGTGALPRPAQTLFDFLPAEQMLLCTEAFLRVFERLGERQNRRRARVKFLVQALGMERFRAEIQREWDELERGARTYPVLQPLSDGPAASALDEALRAVGRSGPEAALPDESEPRRGQLAEATVPGRLGEPSLPCAEDFDAWVAAQTRPQSQRGFRTARVSLASGWIRSEQLRQLAALAERFGLSIRTTPEQGFLLRWARVGQLPEIHRALAGAHLLNRLAVSRLVACPGTSRCSNAFTNARAVAQALTARLATLSDPAGALNQLRIHVSGCFHGCGLHAIADIGLEGVTLRSQEEWLPAYRVWLGGREAQERPRVGTHLAIIPARRAPDCVAEIAACYLQDRQPEEPFSALVERVGFEPFAALIQRHQVEQMPDWQALTIDWGETGRYRPRTAEPAGIC